VLDAQVIRRTLRVPAPAGELGDGAVVARQLDAVLLGVGYGACEAMRELPSHPSEGVAGLQPGLISALALLVRFSAYNR
jgi:hypothetical protein